MKADFELSGLDGRTVRCNFFDCRVAHDVIRKIEYVAKRRKIFGIDAARLGVSLEKQNAAGESIVCFRLLVNVRNERPAKSEMRVEFRGFLPGGAAVTDTQQVAVVRGYETLDRRFGRGKLFKNPRRADDRRRLRCLCASFGFGLGQCSFLRGEKRGFSCLPEEPAQCKTSVMDQNAQITEKRRKAPSLQVGDIRRSAESA